MGSSSNRRSGSSGRSKARKRVVIGAEETVRVRYRHNEPQVESERRKTRPKRTSDNPARAKSTAGRKLAKTKKSERERRQQTIRARRTALGIVALAALALLLWGCIALYNAPILEVRRVAVVGNRHLSDAEVLETASVPEDTTLIKLPSRAIEARLMESPWIKSANVDRDFPDALRIEVKERTPALVVDQGGTNLWLVSADGYWLGRWSGETTGTIQVNGVGKTAARPGTRVANPEIRNAIRVAAGLSDELREITASISAPSVEKTALHTVDDVEIFIGDAEEMAKKDRVAREILKQHPGAVYINVRVPDDPTWRGLQAEPE